MSGNIKAPKWHNNSCYIDSLVYTLHCVAPDILSKIRPNVDRDFAKAVRTAFANVDIAALRKLFHQVDSATDWLREQQEPIEVIYLLENYFALPRTVYTRETVYGSNHSKPGHAKLISDHIKREHFASVVIDADKDKRMRFESKDIDTIENWEKGYKYRILNKHIISDRFVMIHINRNNFGSKSTAAVYPVKTLQSSCSLKAIIVHIGNTTNSGHYVSYMLKGKTWFLYDDMLGIKEIGDTLPDMVFKNSSDYIYTQEQNILPCG